MQDGSQGLGDAGKDKETKKKKKKKHLRRGVTASIDQNFPTVLTTKVIFLIINRVAWKFYYSERDWYLQ